MNATMKKLSMCRICLSDVMPLCSIVNTHLHEIYEALTKMPLLTNNSSPIQVCDLCCACLENSYELRMRCLQSEKLFTQLLRSNVQVNLQIMPDRHLSLGHVIQMIPVKWDNVKVKQEDAGGDNTSPASEDVSATYSFMKVETETDNEMPAVTEEDPLKEDDHFQSSDSGDVSLAIRKNQSDNTANDAAMEQDDSELYRNILGLPKECDLVKEKSIGDADAQDDSGSEDDTAKNNITTKTEADDVLPNDAAVEQDDPELYRNTLGLPTECDLVKKESLGDADARDDLGSEDDTEKNNITQTEADNVLPSVPVTKKPRQMNYEDIPANNFTRSDQTKDNIEAPTRETKRVVEDKPVEKNKIVETHDKIDIRLYKNKQNYSISDHEEAHKEMSENKISAGQSINSSSSNKKQLFCVTCKKCFRRKGDLIRHIRTHAGEKPYNCNVCKKCFSKKIYFNSHMRTHTGEKPYVCNVCKKCFSHKGNFNEHTRTHTGEKPYKCNICNKCFCRQGHLDMHTRVHTGEKPYKCNVCKKCFSCKFSLDRHTRTHTGEKPYECNVCKKCFRDKGTLYIHTRVHTGEKPYKCNVCKKCFSGKVNLDRHTRTHTGEKPYKCNVCKKYFSKKAHLDIHMRTHTGEKPYKCNVCKKCFRHKGSLDRHTRTHPGEKPYDCNVCKKCFSDKGYLDKHTRTHTH